MKYNGICKKKGTDGIWYVRITDGDMDLGLVSESEYRFTLITPKFEELPDCDGMPQGFGDNAN